MRGEWMWFIWLLVEFLLSFKIKNKWKCKLEDIGNEMKKYF